MKDDFKIIICFLLLLAGSCRDNSAGKIKLRVHIRHAYGFKVLVETIPFIGEASRIVDSATVQSGDDIVEFGLPDKDRPYVLRVDKTRFQVVFISDAKQTEIEINNIVLPDQYRVYGSPATEAIHKFLEEQLSLMNDIRRRNNQADSTRAAQNGQHDSLKRKNGTLLRNFFERYIQFEDTVSNAGAFLYIYNNVDFGNNYKGLKDFILRNAKRFPQNQQVQKLKDETLNYLKIFEEEYAVGDLLPELVLPDRNGVNYSTYSLKGKYVFMDFWSTWCGECLEYDKEKEKLKRILPHEKFELISIALDAEKDSWLKYLQAKKYNWPQLIDEKMWSGPTVKTYKIDSIPFNFLLSPDGTVLAKGIRADSVLAVVSRNIK